MKPSLLLTGPVSGLERYGDAARSAGWQAIEFPLLEIHPRRVRFSLELDRPPDWLCVTSQNALPALLAERDLLRGVPCATLGHRCAASLREAGFRVEIEGVRNAGALAMELFQRITLPTLVLWPRGSVSDDLGRLLHGFGAQVCQPVVYETLERAEAGPLPPARVAFFASPSAVEAYSRRAARGEVTTEAALAIGPTTLRALESKETWFFSRLEALAQPSPAELRNHLLDWGEGPLPDR